MSQVHCVYTIVHSNSLRIMLHQQLEIYSSTSIVLIVVVCISCNLSQFSNIICGRVTATLCLSGLLLLCEVHKNSDKLILIIIVLWLPEIVCLFTFFPGVSILEGVRLEGVDVEGGRVTGVRTNKGNISCEIFVNCAGQV